MKNFFIEILFDKEFDQLNNMVRWNGVNRLKDESVAHHSFIVTWFTRLMTEEIFEDDRPKLIASTYAMFHDFDEMFTGDIIHTFKYNNYNGDDIRDNLDDYLSHAVNVKFPLSTTKSNTMLNNNLMGSSIPPYLKKIVKLSDWLSMRFYLQKEMDLGNRSVAPLKEYCKKSIDKATKDCKASLESQNEYKVNLSIFE